MIADATGCEAIYGLDGTLLYRDNATTGERTDYIAMGGHSVGRMSQTGAFTWTHADHLGGASAATDGSGAITWRESYLPFGEVMDDPAANRDQAGFTGHIRDAATGLTYAQARYYNPVTARFLAPDPVGFSDMGPGYFNRYAYTMNDPVNLVDLDGRAAHPPYLDPDFTQNAVLEGWMTQEEADQFEQQQRVGGLVLAGVVTALAPDPTDLVVLAAGARLLRMYKSTTRAPRPRSGPGSRRGGIHRVLANNTGRSNMEVANEIFDEVVGDIPVSSTRGGGRTANLGNGRQITVRTDSQGGATISVQIQTTGSRIIRREEIKIRVREDEG